MSATMEKICRTCKFTFSFPMAEATFACPACSAVNGRPQAEGAGYDHLTRATRQRLGCDFHNAVSSYQHVLLDYPDEHEALWGLTLCRYGVEYVEDPRSGTLMPTVHSVRRRPMQADKDFLNACEQAPENVRAQYEAEAAYIDDAMARIRELAQTQKPYDVFICHKTTKPDSGDPTWECLRASEMAHQLEKLGYRVFFAPEAMKGEIGADYEAAIYHALDTAKVLLLLCAEPDYVTSPWVRSEWTRFLEMTDEREDKRLVPLLYGDFTPAKLPRELRPYRLECVSMDSFTAASDVLRLLEKCCGERGAEEKKPAPVKTAPAKTTPAKSAPAKKAAPSIEAPDRVLAEMDMYPVETANRPATVQPAVIYAPESDFETASVDGGCSITKYKGQGGHVNVPPMIGGRKVVEIGEEAFEECSSLTSIILPEGVTSIGYSAFSSCRSLTSITLSESLTSIENKAFSYCESLASIVLPEGLTSIGEWAFAGCSSLTSIVLPEGLTSIGEWAFVLCSSLASITLPASIRVVGSNPFSGCEKLRVISVPASHKTLSVVDGVLFSKDGKCLICYPCSLMAAHYNVPLGVTSIGKWAFSGCSSLTSITLPEGVTSIGNVAFSGCSSLTSITIPDSVTSICLGAFNGCSSLTSVSLPEAAQVDKGAFLECSKLKPENIVRRPKAGTVKPASAKPTAEKKPAPAPAPNYASEFETAPVYGGCAITGYRGNGGDVKIPPTIGGLQVIEIRDGAFSNCRDLRSIVLPEGLTYIGDHVFSSCSGLTSITLPESLTRIWDSAFKDCSSLTSITLPEGVDVIRAYTFAGCTSLTSVSIPNGVKQIMPHAFSGCTALNRVAIPASVKLFGLHAFEGCDKLPLVQKLRLKIEGAM